MTQQHASAHIMYYLITIAVGIISSLMSFGFFKVIRQMDKGQDFIFSDFFIFLGMGNLQNHFC